MLHLKRFTTDSTCNNRFPLMIRAAQNNVIVNGNSSEAHIQLVTIVILVIGIVPIQEKTGSRIVWM